MLSSFESLTGIAVSERKIGYTISVLPQWHETISGKKLDDLSVLAVACNPKLDIIAVSLAGLTDGTGPANQIRFYDFEDLQNVGNRFYQHSNLIWAIAFDDSGCFMATACEDKSIRLFHVEAIRNHGERDLWEQQFNSPVRCIRFRPKTLAGNAMLAAGFAGSGLKILCAKTGNTLLGVKHTGWVNALDFSPAGDCIATGCGSKDGNRLRVFQIGSRDRTTSKAFGSVSGTSMFSVTNEDHVVALSWSPLGKLIAVGCRCGRLRLLRSDDGSSVREVRHSSKVRALSWHPSGEVLASSSWDDGELFLLDPSTGLFFDKIELAGRLNSMSWTKHSDTFGSNLLAVGSDKKGVFLVRTARSESLLSAPFSVIIRSLSGDVKEICGVQGHMKASELTERVSSEFGIPFRETVLCQGTLALQPPYDKEHLASLGIMAGTELTLVRQSGFDVPRLARLKHRDGQTMVHAYVLDDSSKRECTPLHNGTVVMVLSEEGEWANVQGFVDMKCQGLIYNVKVSNLASYDPPAFMEGIGPRNLECGSGHVLASFKGKSTHWKCKVCQDDRARRATEDRRNHSTRACSRASRYEDDDSDYDYYDDDSYANACTFIGCFRCQWYICENHFLHDWLPKQFDTGNSVQLDGTMELRQADGKEEVPVHDITWGRGPPVNSFRNGFQVGVVFNDGAWGLCSIWEPKYMHFPRESGALANHVWVELRNIVASSYSPDEFIGKFKVVASDFKTYKDRRRAGSPCARSVVTVEHIEGDWCLVGERSLGGMGGYGYGMYFTIGWAKRCDLGEMTDQDSFDMRGDDDCDDYDV